MARDSLSVKNPPSFDLASASCRAPLEIGFEVCQFFLALMIAHKTRERVHSQRESARHMFEHVQCNQHWVH